MSTHALVNNIDHKDLKIITERSAEYGDNIWYSMTFPMEFRSIQAYYPIFFLKDANTGHFFSTAIFGFTEQENLFLVDKKWDAAYVPLSVQRQPFLIGVQNITEDGIQKQHRVLQIDLNNPKVNTSEGEALFLEFGGNTPYLDNAADVLETLHHGVEDDKVFVETLLEHNLLESFNLDVELNDRSKHQMIGFYTINEDKLKELSSDVLKSLHDKNYMQAIYMAIASQSNIRDLLNRKNRLMNL